METQKFPFNAIQAGKLRPYLHAAFLVETFLPDTSIDILLHHGNIYELHYDMESIEEKDIHAIISCQQLKNGKNIGIVRKFNATGVSK